MRLIVFVASYIIERIFIHHQCYHYDRYMMGLSL
jgi:hypothetical protein